MTELLDIYRQIMILSWWGHYGLGGIMLAFGMTDFGRIIYIMCRDIHDRI